MSARSFCPDHHMYDNCLPGFRLGASVLKNDDTSENLIVREEMKISGLERLAKVGEAQSEDFKKVYDPCSVASRVEQKESLTGDAEMDSMLREVFRTINTKGKEYTGGSPDRLANFRGVGEDIGLPMEKAWYIFFNKHYRAIQSYIRNGCRVLSEEPIAGRIKDIIVYSLLFYKMVLEIERDQKKTAEVAHHPV